MTQKAANEYAASEAKRLCDCNSHFEQYCDGESAIEIEYRAKERLSYRLEVSEKKVAC